LPQPPIISGRLTKKMINAKRAHSTFPAITQYMYAQYTG
jgi:hypothetical protein